MNKPIQMVIALILLVTGITTVALADKNIAIGLILYVMGREMLNDLRKIVLVRENEKGERSRHD